MNKHTADRTSVDLIDSSPHHLLRRALQKYNRAWQKSIKSLSPQQYASLIAIRELPGLNQSRLSRMTAIDSSTLAEMLSRMEKRQLLVRKEAPNNSRHNQLQLTESGLEAMAEVKPIEKAVKEEVIGGLSAEETATLVALLQKIVYTES